RGGRWGMGWRACGGGAPAHYASQGFLHVDVGKPRFLQTATSRTDEDLSGGSARACARTGVARDTAGELVLVRLHGITAPPVRLQRAARLEPDGGSTSAAVTVEEGGAPAAAGCIGAGGTTRL